MTAKSQEAFEQHYKDCHDLPDAVFPKSSRGTYGYPSHFIDFKLWQAAEAYGRKQALEDVANGLIKQKSWTQDYAHAVVQHAADEGSLK